MFCTNCGEPCNVVEAVVGFGDCWDSRREQHYTEDEVAEVSDCYEAEVTRYDPRECYGCDALGTIQCPDCHYWFCVSCFGSALADAGGRCADCAGLAAA
jgi:hypothetical protein